MILGIDASQANKVQRTGTEWYAFHIITQWMRSNPFFGYTVRLYVREPLRPDFGSMPKGWEVRVLRWPPKIFWTHVRLSWELFWHPINALFIPAHTIPLKHPDNTFTTIHDVGFEATPEVYSKKSVVHVESFIVQKVLTTFIRCVTLGSYGAHELDYQRFSVRYAISHAKKIFTVSHFSKKEILRFFPTNTPIIVAENGIDHSEFYFPINQTKIEKIKRKYHIQNYVLALGRIEKKKKSLELIETFYEYTKKSTSSNTKLVFAGPDGHGAEEVRDFAKKHLLESRVIFLGWVQQQDIASLLAGASCFVFFSAYEGFGVPLVQSLAVGTPVLSSPLDVFKEIGGRYITTCDTQHTLECAKILQEILENKKAGHIKEASIHSKKYSWESTAKKIAGEITKSLA